VKWFDEITARWRHRSDELACRDLVELVTDFLEGALAPADRKHFERHLTACPECTAYVEQVRLTAATLGHLQPSPPTGATRQALLTAFRDFKRT
jgi:anti-sigma factor RsiW